MYKEHIGDLFENIKNNKPKEGIMYAQCISNDLAMGAGIAVKFNQYFNTKKQIHKQKNYFIKTKIQPNQLFSYKEDCIFSEPVFCLITKERFWHKPTLESFTNAINNFIIKVKQEQLKRPIKEIRCPLLGCGLDKLKWQDVKPILETAAEKLEENNIDMVVYKLK